MLRLLLLAFILALSTSGATQPPAAQLDIEDVLDRMEVARQLGMVNVSDYTRIEKSSAAGTSSPSVQYFERATDEDGNPLPIFRMVPPNELANRETVARGEASAEQRVEGLRSALPHLANTLDQLGDKIGVDVSAYTGGGALAADLTLEGILVGQTDTNADALDALRDFELIRLYPSTVQYAQMDGGLVYLITTTDVEDINIEAGDMEGIREVQARVLRRWVDPERLVTLRLHVTLEATTDNGQTIPWFVERVNSSFKPFGPNPMLVPSCVRGTLSFGGRDLSSLIMRRYIEMNQGPPSSARQQEMIGEAMDDFENYTCD